MVMFVRSGTSARVADGWGSSLLKQGWLSGDVTGYEDI